MIKSCYGNPVSAGSGHAGENDITLNLPTGSILDRLMLQEDISVGQAVRSFVIYELSSTSAETWIKLYENTRGIGNKKIVLLNQPISYKEQEDAKKQKVHDEDEI